MQFMTGSLTVAQAHRCLTPDEIFGHFGQRRAAAREKYRDFARGDQLWRSYLHGELLIKQRGIN